MNASGFRRLALSFPDAEEGAHMGHADFRANGQKIFATLDAEERRGMVSLTPDEQQEFLAAHPSMFSPASGAWGRGGATMVDLAAADEEIVGEAMTLAWKGAVQKLEGNRQKAKGKGKGPQKSPRRS